MIKIKVHLKLTFGVFNTAGFKGAFFKKLKVFSAIALVLFFSACSDQEGNSGTEDEDNRTVTFDAQDGEPIPEPQTVKKGETISEPEAEPIKTNGETFLGWYKSLASNALPFDFDTPIEENFTLYARWEVNTISIVFMSEGSEDASYEVIRGREFASRVELNNLHTKFESRGGSIFEGWFYNLSGGNFTDPVEYPAVFTHDATLYAKWIDFADLDGVWAYTNNLNNKSNFLIADEHTGWLFEHFNGFIFSEMPLFVYPGTFSADKQTVTLELAGETTVTKISETKTPKGNSALAGFWSSDGGAFQLKEDGSAVVGDSGGAASLDIKYAADDFQLYLLRENAPHYVLASIPLKDGKPEGFAKIIIDDALRGIWEIESGGKKAAYQFTTRTDGNYYALGISLEFTYTLSEGEEDGLLYISIRTMGDAATYTPYGYEIFENKLAVYADEGKTIEYTKLSAVPDYSGGSGDTELNGRWIYTDNSGINFSLGYIEFGREGLFTRYERSSFTYSLWQADAAAKKLTFYLPDIGSMPGDVSDDYEVKIIPAPGWNTLEFGDRKYQRSPIDASRGIGVNHAGW